MKLTNLNVSNFELFTNMISELSVTSIGIACSLPALVELYMDDFASDKWETYVKLMPQLFLVVAIILRLLSKFSMTLAFTVLGLLLTYFCLLFNSSASTSAACDEYSDLCADEIVPVCANNPIEGWQGLLYQIGLSLMTVGSTLLIKENMALYKMSKTAPRR